MYAGHEWLDSGDLIEVQTASSANLQNSQVYHERSDKTAPLHFNNLHQPSIMLHEKQITKRQIQVLIKHLHPNALRPLQFKMTGKCASATGFTLLLQESSATQKSSATSTAYL